MSSTQISSPYTPASHPVTGTFSDGHIFEGELRDLRARVADGVLILHGTVGETGLITSGKQFEQELNLRIDDTLRILTLNLEPLELEQCGLKLDLAPVQLDVTEGHAGGHLLVTMLAWVAGLLKVHGPVDGIATLLNRIFLGLGLGRSRFRG
ncbi:MAG: hypothetical protein J2P23_06245 [Microlunatus sp.]|nr:hypothetical protein [Microlunatus sp.]